MQNLPLIILSGVLALGFVVWLFERRAAAKRLEEFKKTEDLLAAKARAEITALLEMRKKAHDSVVDFKKELAIARGLGGDGSNAVDSKTDGVREFTDGSFPGGNGSGSAG